MFKNFIIVEIEGDFNTTNRLTCISFNIDENKKIAQCLETKDVKLISNIFKLINVRKQKISGMENLFSFNKNNVIEVIRIFENNCFVAIAGNIDIYNELFGSVKRIYPI